jgi:hypothetical protein
MDVFVVYDTKGCGRLVGVFDDPARAQAAARINPHYYRVVRTRVNAINPEVVPWALDDRERNRLAALVDGAEASDDAG